MVRNLYLILVVVFRTIGLACIAGALLPYLGAAILTLGRGPLLAALISFIPVLLSGVILWFVAKPIARIITRNLDE